MGKKEKLVNPDILPPLSLFDSLSRLCVFTATPRAPRSKRYVRFHPQLIKGVGALGSDMVTPIQVKDLT